MHFKVAIRNFHDLDDEGTTDVMRVFLMVVR